MNTSIPDITPTQRRSLRALAHPLKPVVSISQKGLTETVLTEIDRCLNAHELIKIRVYGHERDQREALLVGVCTMLKAAAVQHIGHLLVVWREKAAVPVPADPVAAVSRRRTVPMLTKKAAAAKTDKAARSRKIVLGKPRRPTRS
ncbi:MAG: YhbY family RNA-binding protein [Sterolibacterium sp.]